jgi:hypothetical protein
MSKGKTKANNDVTTKDAPAVDARDWENQAAAHLPIDNDDRFTDALVKRVEQAARQGRVNPADLITADTRGVLVLFPYEPLNRREGVVYPVMKGHLDSKNVRCPASVFAHVTEEGRPYISLSLGVEGQAHIGGAMFRYEEQNPSDGRWELVPGKENLRFGQITKSVLVDKDGKEYDVVFQLQVSGKRKMSAAGVPFIKADVYPSREKADESLEAMQDCF